MQTAAVAATVHEVSDVPPPPPPPPSATPVPPPPPNLMAPPGYAGYSPSPMTSAVPLKRVSGLAKGAIALCLASGVLAVLELVVRNASVDEAEAYQAGELSNTDFIEEIAAYALFGFLISVVTVAAAVLTIIWMFRVASNHRALHRGTTWGPGWAIGGWFAPPMLYIIPMLALMEMWKASDPDVPVGGDWRRGRSNPLIPIWFVLYSLVPLALFAGQAGDLFDSLGGSEDQLAEQITADPTLSIAGAAATVAAAIVFAMIVRSMTDRHRRLTGEAAR